MTFRTIILLFLSMTTKDISVNGTVFPCPVAWTVDQAEGRIRSAFCLHFGGLRSDGIPQLGSDLISNTTGSLVFVGGRPVQVPVGDNAGKGCSDGRKHARTDFFAESATYQLKMATQRLSYSSSEDEQVETNKTCFYVGEWIVKSTNEKKPIWVTALHNGLKVSMLVRINNKKDVDEVGTVIYASELSDIAIISTSIVPLCDPLIIQSRRYELANAVIAGYSMHGGDDKPALLSCHIAKVEAESTVAGLLRHHQPDDKYAKWRTRRFFLLDKTTDFGFSGAPVVDSFGDVIGMFCASERVSVSWALKSDFIDDALDECLLREFGCLC